MDDEHKKRFSLSFNGAHRTDPISSFGSGENPFEGMFSVSGGNGHPWRIMQDGVLSVGYPFEDGSGWHHTEHICAWPTGENFGLPTGPMAGDSIIPRDKELEQ